MRLFTGLVVSYHWTFIKQEANIGTKPQLWSIVSLWHQELGECLRTSKSEIFSRCFWILNQSDHPWFQMSVGLYCGLHMGCVDMATRDCWGMGEKNICLYIYFFK